MKLGKYWTEEKINLLKKSYKDLSKVEIQKLFPNHKWRTLQNISNFLGVKREYSEIRNGKIENLFNGSYESYYWLGLIATDGYISKDGELKVELSLKDYDYLKNFSEFIESSIYKYPPYKSSKPNSKGTCRVKVKDINLGVKLRNLLKVNGKKTYNSISIDFIKDKDSLISFLCGYIDGDGTINKYGDIKIDSHKNNYEFMDNFGRRLVEENIINKYSLTTYENMVRINISRTDSYNLKKYSKALSLPTMVRKWGNIPDNIKPKNNILAKNKELILKLRAEGKTLKEISEKINYKSIGNISCFIKNNLVYLQ